MMFGKNLFPFKYFNSFINFPFASKKIQSSSKAIQRERSFELLLKKLDDIKKKNEKKERKGTSILDIPKSEIIFDEKTNTYYNKTFYKFEEEKSKNTLPMEKPTTSIPKKTNNQTINSKKHQQVSKELTFQSETLTKLKTFEQNISEYVAPALSVHDPESSTLTRREESDGKTILTEKKLKNIFKSILTPKMDYQFLKGLAPENYLTMIKNEDSLKVENIDKINLILTILRKSKTLQYYERPEIKNTISFICKHFDLLSDEGKSALCVSLSKMKSEDLTFYKLVEANLMEKASMLSLRTLANIVHSFIFISKKQSIMTDFLELFRHLETILAIKMKQEGLENCDTKSLMQIAVAYSKTQNISNEFLTFIENICIDSFEKFRPRELCPILYSLTKNRYKSSALAEKMYGLFTQHYERFKVKEIILSLQYFEFHEKIDNKILEICSHLLTTRRDLFNIQDFSKIVRFLLKSKLYSKEVSKTMHEMLLELYPNIDQNCFIDLSCNIAENINEKKVSKGFLRVWSKCLRYLLKHRKLKGIYYKQIVDEVSEIENRKLKEAIVGIFHTYRYKLHEI